MHSVPAIIFAISCLLCVANATQVSQCEGKQIKGLQENVKISNCSKQPCKLRKKTTSSVELKFTPDVNITTLTTNVFAEVLGLPLPFVGVDGISACDKIYLEDATTLAPCPLKAKTTYVYKNSFPILEIYPRLSVVVQWSLSQNNNHVTCFRVNARIL